MPLNLRLKSAPRAAVGGEVLSPDRLMGSLAEIASRLVWVGNEQVELGSLFDISGTPNDGTVVLEGDLRGFGGVATRMASGSLVIRGDVGNRLGQEMQGGSILVEGSVGDWAGAEIRAGSISISGNAGHFLGAALPGSRSGMKGGWIHVKGSTGDDAGLAMRRGLIAVQGSVGENLGRGMITGSILTFDQVGPGIGLGMKRGTIGLFGQGPASLSVGFEPSGSFRPHVLPILLNQLKADGFPVAPHAFSEPIRRYNGDRIERGQGELWVSRASGY